MDMASVEKDLRRRINQSSEWIESGRTSLISDLQIRKFPCKAEPVKFLDYRNRVERYGIRFRLEFITSQGSYESFVDILIKDTRSMSKDEKSIANPPYIVIYALNHETQKTELISYEYLENTQVYKKSLSQSIEEWYKDWLFKTLRHDKNVSKIIKFKKKT